MRYVSDGAEIKIERNFDTETVLDAFNEIDMIYGLAVNLHVTKADPDFFFRLVLEDMKGKKYVVAESYKEIASKEDEIAYEDYCEETALLGGVQPKSLRLYVNNAVVYLNSLKVSLKLPSELENESEMKNAIDEVRLMQVQDKVYRINTYNQKEEKLWLAGVTTLSLKDFNTRIMQLGFPESISSGGLEYYVDGLFEFPVPQEEKGRESRGLSKTQTFSNPSSLFVRNFTWADRHGKDWTTSVKDQGRSGFCSAFAAVSCTEALVNLYFNQNPNLDLSEQQAACCNGYPNPWYGMPNGNPLEYIKNSGVYDEAGYPFVDSETEANYCRTNEAFASEIVSFSDYSTVSTLDEDSIKSALINYGPLSSGYKVSSPEYYHAHAMAIIGFFEIHVGDSLRAVRKTGSCENCYGLDSIIVVKDTTYNHIGNIIGKTCWIFKNSYTDTPYMKILFQNANASMLNPLKLHTPVTWSSFDNNGVETVHTEVACEDSDGDGYYFWGIGSKPANCPYWVPDEPDGDDSNINIGPMDEYGNLSHLTSGTTIDIPLDYNEGATGWITENLGIVNGGVLTVTGNKTLLADRKIRVCEGGVLIIDGGVLNEANLELIPGSTLIIRNGGEIHMASGLSFNAPEGVIVQIEEGEID